MRAPSARLSLTFSCLGHLYVHLFTAFYFVIVLSLEEVWSLPYHELVELWTLGALMVGLAALPAGWLGDRWSARGMMIVYFLGMGGAAILCGLVDQASALLIGLTAIGLFASIYHPVGIAWLIKSAPDGTQGKSLGLNGVFGAVGVASAGLVAGALIDLFSWRAAFIVPGVVCVATGLGLWLAAARGLVVEGTPDSRPHKAAARGEVLRVFLVLVLTMTVMGLIFQATQAALPKVFDLRLRDLAGEGAFGVGALVAAVYTVGGLMQILGGHLADRLPLKPVYICSFLLQIPVLAAIGLLGGVPLVMLAAVSVLLSTGALPAENMLLARYTPERHRSLAYGAKFVLAFGTAPAAIWAVSQVQASTGEFTWVFAGAAVLALLATSAALMLPGDRRAAAETAAPSAQPAE